jgi:hypothetical protein
VSFRSFEKFTGVYGVASKVDENTTAINNLYNCLSQVEVEAIPYVEADNPAGGVTVTIAG